MLSSARLADWVLFVDWCASVSNEGPSTDSGVEVTAEMLEQFLETVPGSVGTQRRRVRNIVTQLRAMGRAAVVPVREVESVFHNGEQFAPIGRALAQIPVTRYPIGLRGRRDAWIVVLVGELGFTRRQAMAVTQTDIELYPVVTVAGRPVRKAEIAGECPACAVFRWLRVIEPANFGNKNETRGLLTPSTTQQIHDCETGLDGRWRTVGSLCPPIDKHGWVTSFRTLSLTSVSNIVRERQQLGELPEIFVPRISINAPFDRAASHELADKYDEVDAKATELLARILNVLSAE